VAQQALLEIRGLTKRYGAHLALEKVSFSVAAGEVVGLIGENGAGKSTLLNIVSGTDTADEGTVTVGGREARFSSYRQANEAGVFRIFQELALIPNIPVHENLFLTHEIMLGKTGVIDRRTSIAKARALLEKYGHGWIDPTKATGDYPFVTRQVIEIIKAFAIAELLGHETPILLLDEPTAALTAAEVDFLKALVDSIRHRAAIVFVSHRLGELLDWSDRVVVLKDGKFVAEAHTGDLSEDRLHQLMVGRVRDEFFYHEDRQATPEVASILNVTSLGKRGLFEDVSFELHKGEILGFGGLLSSGKSVVARTIFGAMTPDTGDIQFEGARLAPGRVMESVKGGIGYVPPERKEDGVFLDFDTTWNVAMQRVIAGKDSQWRTFPSQERRDASTFVDKLQIRPNKLSALARNLSGGNQQKVVLARWLSLGVKVLILDNPTRGIDAGAKTQIYALLRELIEQGMSIVLVSDDILELIGLCNRIMIMRGGRIQHEFTAAYGNKPSEADLVAAMV